ncbi:glucosaminidase domain-containing protein [Paenibacillus alvei]|uniref:Glucosaminidase domain-containing protein n=1 Tax=Paenibacillus alvei TaxID=44250 RepID=A0ABT4H0Y5_PAEAL|nr:glucosaminidase domain-containing protein [Paenibacillus alvei]MCY9543716.1 glucosaminidase domain-containing protein [Paenibacillus alvei]MCY9708221.1 glucosaminidase domain-containing protein [Paenibacillus alvei]MCY9737929.1 glucosaminidase domain-containing protein [Paenibacillus alvei]MCY9758461.1 glucosaminidase domain-containing protein [Paenibacillus alvei]MCY9762641.1 glucosaminidase domain-containing protein [Paenibacillus alvei]
MNNTLGGVLKGTGDLFVKYGNKYGIDPALLAAISIHETGNGSSPAARNKFNLGGMMDPATNWSKLMSFDSIESGIDAMARNLKKNYLDQGITSIQGIGGKYAPLGAKNDPRGLNQHWVPSVTKYYNQLRG